MITVRLGAAACLVTAALLSVPPSSGASTTTPGRLQAEIARVTTTERSLAIQDWDNAAETRLVERIDELADTFHEFAADGTATPKIARELISLAEAAHRRYADVLAAMQAEVIRIDGDLEAVQDSPAWQQRELLAMRLLYRLNWLRYESAMRYETTPAVRKRLLQQAQTGFSEFLGSGDAELTVESLLGHGLTVKALKNYTTAIADFRAALAMKPSAELSTRLLVPLVQALLASDDLTAALSNSSKLLGKAKRGELRSQALFLHAKTLLLVLRETRGTAAAAKLRKQVAPVLEQLYGRSDYWKSKVVQLIDSGVDSPEAWQDASSSGFVSWLVADSLQRRGQCDAARKLYTTLLESDAFTVESHFGLGSCAFRDGNYGEAIDRFAAYLDKADAGDPNHDKAAYLRFKAGESLYLQSDNETTEAARAAEQRYITLLRDFIDRAPAHPSLFEAWYRLGEWYRGNHQYLECAEAFNHVKGAAAFEIKAGFLSGQCYVEAVLATPEGEAPASGLVKQAVARLDGFLEVAEKFSTNGSPDRAMLVRPLAAKAVVMAAAVISRGNTGTMSDRLARLRDFEQLFPNQTSLLPEVYSLRIVALRELGELDKAGIELERLLDLDNDAVYRGDSLKKLGLVFLEEAAKRDEQGDTSGALHSRQVALSVYQHLLEDTRTADPSDSAIDALENLVEDLRSQLRAP